MTSGGNSINDFPENQLSKPIPASIHHAATANAVYNGQALLQSVNLLGNKGSTVPGSCQLRLVAIICPSPLTYSRQRPITASHSSRYDMLAIISSRYQYGPFLIFCCISYVKLLDYCRAEKNFLYFRRPPWGLKLVAVATSATWLIRHWGPTATCKSQCTIYSDYSPRQCIQYI